jgi:SAM-dependent methyltransferase
MLVSVFTPSHRSTWLADAYACLRAQTHAEWEWVLLLNGGADDVPASIADDPRVRVLRAPAGLERQGVGALKRYACELARGEWLFELDHDDLLAPQALQRVVEAAADPAVGFVYSDFCNFREDGSCEVFDPAYGWESYPVRANGREFTALRAFDADASALSAIHFAPNHLRAWRRELYLRIGAHDPALAICDDYELLCRTWLSGAGFAHLRECLYFYRLQPEGSNTYLQRNAEIQRLQQEISDRYRVAMVEEWCRRRGLPMLDLGGAHNSAAGYLSVDLRNADVVCDVRRGLPYADATVGCIRAQDFLEHIPHCASDCTHGEDGSARCVVGVMNELYRVLVPGGWLLARTPSTDGRGAFQDPTHVSFWNPNSFWYYTRREQARYVEGIRCRFQPVRLWQEYPSDWHREHHILYVNADLVALKGQRQPGICEI